MGLIGRQRHKEVRLCHDDETKCREPRHGRAWERPPMLLVGGLKHRERRLCHDDETKCREPRHGRAWERPPMLLVGGLRHRERRLCHDDETCETASHGWLTKNLLTRAWACLPIRSYGR